MVVFSIPLNRSEIEEETGVEAGQVQGVDRDVPLLFIHGSVDAVADMLTVHGENAAVLELRKARQKIGEIRTVMSDQLSVELAQNVPAAFGMVGTKIGAPGHLDFVDFREMLQEIPPAPTLAERPHDPAPHQICIRQRSLFSNTTNGVLQDVKCRRKKLLDQQWVPG